MTMIHVKKLHLWAFLFLLQFCLQAAAHSLHVATYRITKQDGDWMLAISLPLYPLHVELERLHGKSELYLPDGNYNKYLPDGNYNKKMAADYLKKNTSFFSVMEDVEIPLSMSVSADRSDIITVGSYASTLAYDDYNGVDVEIPISSISSMTGVTTLTVTLSYADVEVTRTIYVEVG